jgi:hypothetical protein
VDPEEEGFEKTQVLYRALMGVLSEENGWLVSSHIHEASPSRMSSLSLKKQDTKNVNGKKVKKIHVDEILYRTQFNCDNKQPKTHSAVT